MDNLNGQVDVHPLAGQEGAPHYSQVQPQSQEATSQNGVSQPLVPPQNNIAPINETDHPKDIEEESSYHPPIENKWN